MDLGEFPRNWDIAKVLGNFGKNRKLWKEYSFTGIIEKLKVSNRKVVLDCGVDDFALKGNRKVHARMIELDIPHEYFERPGGHTPVYVRNCIEYHIITFSQVLLKPKK